MSECSKGNEVRGCSDTTTIRSDRSSEPLTATTDFTSPLMTPHVSDTSHLTLHEWHERKPKHFLSSHLIPFNFF